MNGYKDLLTGNPDYDNGVRTGWKAACATLIEWLAGDDPDDHERELDAEWDTPGPEQMETI